jgi:hypothetical protein
MDDKVPNHKENSMNSSSTFGAAVVASALLTAGNVHAQDGYVSLSFGDYNADLIDDGGTYNGDFTSLDLLYSFSAGPGKLVLEGGYRTDDLSPEASDDDEMTNQSFLAAHYVYGFGNGATVNGFLGYGKARHAESFTNNEDFPVIYGGIGGSFAFDPNWVAYGQLGLGNNPDSGITDSFGFYRADFARAGVTFTGLQGTALTLELEKASAEQYEDFGEPGDFGAVSFGGVTALASNTSWQFSYGVRSSFYDSREIDGDRTEETSASVGVRYVFGGKTPGEFEREGILGSPYLPLRASSWTPSID